MTEAEILNGCFWNALLRTHERVERFHAKLKTDEGQKLVAASLENNALYQHLKSKPTNQ